MLGKNYASEAARKWAGKFVRKKTSILSRKYASKLGSLFEGTYKRKNQRAGG